MSCSGDGSVHAAAEPFSCAVGVVESYATSRPGSGDSPSRIRTGCLSKDVEVSRAHSSVMDIAVQSLLAVLSGTHRKIRTRLARQKRSAVFAGHTQTRTHTPHTSRGHHESTTPSRTRQVTSHGQTTERVSAGFSPAKAHPRHKRCLKHKLNRGECDAEPPLASHSDPFLDWDCSSRITTVTLALGVTRCHAIRLAKEFRSFEGTPRLCFHRGCCRIRWRITSSPLPLHGATTCLFQPVRSQFHVAGSRPALLQLWCKSYTKLA